MLNVLRLTPGHPMLPKALRLLDRAFPPSELLPPELLMDQGDGSRDFLALTEGESLVGVLCLLSWQDITHILFFAIDEALRSRGYGSRALAMLRHFKPGQRIIADVEAADAQASNPAQRARRRQFYLRNGYRPTAIHYRWRGEWFDILSLGGGVTQEEFHAFWQHFEGKRPVSGA